MPSERVRRVVDDLRERGLPAVGERLHLRRRDRHAAIPRRAQLLHARRPARPARSPFSEAGQRLELDDQRLALGELARERDLMAVVVPLEEPIGRGAEPVQISLGLVAAHRTDRLPLGLQPLHLGRRRRPSRWTRRAPRRAAQSASFRARFSDQIFLRVGRGPRGAARRTCCSAVRNRWPRSRPGFARHRARLLPRRSAAPGTARRPGPVGRVAPALRLLRRWPLSSGGCAARSSRSWAK